MYDRILVPVDGSATARTGLDEAVALAGRLGSSLRVLYVVDARMLFAEVSAYTSPQQMLDAWRAGGQRLVDAAVEQARAEGLTADGVVRCEPSQRVCDTILDEAKASGAGLIVMGTHGRRGLRRVALGSDAEQVLRESTVPVLLVRGAAESSPA